MCGVGSFITKLSNYPRMQKRKRHSDGVKSEMHNFCRGVGVGWVGVAVADTLRMNRSIEKYFRFLMFNS